MTDQTDSDETDRLAGVERSRTMGGARKWAWFVLGMAASAVLVIVIYSVVTGASNTETVKDRQTTNGKRISDSSKTLKLVKDCVTPGGACYERGQRQTASAVGSLSNASKASAAAAAACAAQPEIQQAPSVRSRTSMILNCMDGTMVKRP